MLNFDQEKLISLLTDFYLLTGIKICVFDDEENEISYAPEHLCAFCRYVRSSAEGENACRISDRNAFESCRNTGKPYIYSCHMGLTECVSPIVRQGRNIGFVMIGQTAKKGFPFEKIHKQITSYGLDEKKAEALYASVEFSSEEKVRAAVTVTDAIAGYLYLHKLVSESENLSFRVERFIQDNLQNDLSVEALCAKFKVSRVDLYACFKNSFHATPANYIREIRLNKACELLEKGLPITKIARQVGICDYNYFSKIFKKRFLIPPREYRKKPSL